MTSSPARDWEGEYFQARNCAKSALTTKERAKLWEQVRPKLKAIFQASGILTCELCRGSFGLAFAHRLKRRFISTLAELHVVALLCAKCHQSLDEGKGGHVEMFRVITELRESRPV